MPGRAPRDGWPSGLPLALAAGATALVLAGLTGCGDDGTSCSVLDNGDGSATILCDDGTEVTIEGGMDGTSCTVREEPPDTKVIECDDGTSITVRDGVDGGAGTDGRNALVAGPGLTLELQEVGVTAERRPFAVLRLSDAEDRPLDREGRLTSGAVSVSFTVAHLTIETRVDGDVVLPYASYLTETVPSTTGPETAEQPLSERDGTWSVVDADAGIHRYDFAAVLPEGYDPTETHTIGAYATRTFDGTRYVSNAVESFRPDGMEVTATREAVSTNACNTCHTPLAAHGGSREDVRLCLTCHGAGYADPETGNSIDFRTMVHRIHRGASLPSVEAGQPYTIVGFRGRVHDYSEVELPQDIRGCEVCHQGPDADRWKTVPSRAACGSCHDDIWFEAGDPPEPWMRLHPGGDRPNDERCTVCHEASGGLSPITENHFTRLQAPDALMVDFVLHSVSLGASGRPLVDFTVTVNGAGRDLLADPLARFSFTVAGPTTDYAFAASYSPGSSGTLTAIDAAAGRFAFELPDTVSEIAASHGIAAQGTWAIGVEGYEPGANGERYSGPNAIAYLAITDPTPVPRRHVVDIARCNSCHEELAMHGGPRNDPMYCVFCHNANGDTIGRMPLPPVGETADTTSISLAHMIHRIHTGHDGESEFTLWSFRGDPVTFDELHYPADRRVCEKCHVDDDSTDLPLPAGVLAARTRTIDSNGLVLQESFLPPTASACTGCHDAPATYAHAETMTTAAGAEACATCHAAGAEFGVTTVHARPAYQFRSE